ncbi:MAG: hypothetical protein ACKVOE_03805 [Rickettsiales bacterium]
MSANGQNTHVIVRTNTAKTSTTYSDGRATIVVEAGRMTLRDADEEIVIMDDSSGYIHKLGKRDASVKYTPPNNVIQQSLMASEGINLPSNPASYGVSCRNAKTGNSKSIEVIQDVADSVLRHQAQDFARQHPELAAVVARSKKPVAHYDGKDIDFATLLRAPSHFEACPASGAVVDRMGRK